MKIETLFNVGDEVNYLQGSKLKTNIIHSIAVEVKFDGVTIKYWFRNKETGEFDLVHEADVFETIDEFLKQLQQ